MQDIASNVMVIAPTDEISRTILQALAARGVRGLLVAETRAALERLEVEPVRMVFVEIGSAYPEAGEMITRLRCEVPDLPVLAVGSEVDVASAVRAMQAGADDVLAPLSETKLAAALDAVLPGRTEKCLASDVEQNQYLYRIAGRSQALQETIGLARRVARGTVPVLITGESGTGKELISYLIHRQSPRSRNPYIRVNCAAISESLLESELFGHERGAFTGAHARRKGRFELAHSGTLLLDEVSETGPRLQAELLRVLEQQDFERLGGSESINVNVRVICTSNRDLAEEVRLGRFRADLYYRIRGVQLAIPPLRRRPEDIEPLVWHFVNLYAGETGRRIAEIDEATLRKFQQYDWPGNVRQLRNMVRSALILGQGSSLSLDDLPQLRQELCGAETGEFRATAPVNTLSLQDLEREAVLEALRRTNAHQAKAARLLGISDRTLRDKLRRYREDGHLDETGEPAWSANRTL